MTPMAPTTWTLLQGVQDQHRYLMMTHIPMILLWPHHLALKQCPLLRCTEETLSSKAVALHRPTSVGMEEDEDEDVGGDKTEGIRAKDGNQVEGGEDEGVVEAIVETEEEVVEVMHDLGIMAMREIAAGHHDQQDSAKQLINTIHTFLGRCPRPHLLSLVRLGSTWMDQISHLLFPRPRYLLEGRAFGQITLHLNRTSTNSVLVPKRINKTTFNRISIHDLRPRSV